MNEYNGYVKIHRKLLQWGWYQDHPVKELWFHLLLVASFKDTIWQGKELKAGQCIIGTQQLAKDLGFTRQEIRTALKKLSSTGEIIVEPTNKFSVVTLVNWKDYQLCNDNDNYYECNDNITGVLQCVETAEKSTNKLTNKSTNKKSLENVSNTQVEEFEIKGATNKLTTTLTNNQPTTNQQLTNNQPHRKNVKNVKNVKNIYKDIINGVSEELKDLYIEYIKMRELIKSPMTERALNMLIKKVNDLEPTDISRQKKLIETAIINNWKSVYPLKDDKKTEILNNRGFDNPELEKLTRRSN